MKTREFTACLAVLAALTTTTVQAQETPVAEANAPEAVIAPAEGEAWVVFSSNDRNIYLIDLHSFKPVNDATVARIARVPLQGPTTVFMHRIDEYELRCQPNQARMIAEVEMDNDGTEVERYPEADAEWEPMRPASLPAYFKAIVCDNARPNGAPANSIKAFIERGRQ